MYTAVVKEKEGEAKQYLIILCEKNEGTITLRNGM